MTEDEVFDGVLQLVAAGEYSDGRYIQIGPMPEPPRSLPDGTPDHASWRWYRKHQPVTEVVVRGSPEYESARDQGLLRPLPPLPVATAEAVDEAEEVIGFPLPRLLRRLYLEVANGGFGPRGGILGVRGGMPVDGVRDLVELHRSNRVSPDPLWPFWLIGICDWGCAIWSLVDCRDPAGPMWSWDGNTHTLRQHDQTICDWLALWLQCRLDMPEGTAPLSAERARRLREEWNAAHPDQPVRRAARKVSP
ncbi:MAG: hypothetical protein J2P27_00065 [Actinobacteria bacterium]|nr:hypothetical protein [Actinomycetota bacterium]